MFLIGMDYEPVSGVLTDDQWAELERNQDAPEWWDNHPHCFGITSPNTAEVMALAEPLGGFDPKVAGSVSAALRSFMHHENVSDAEFSASIVDGNMISVFGLVGDGRKFAARGKIRTE